MMTSGNKRARRRVRCVGWLAALVLAALAAQRCGAVTIEATERLTDLGWGVPDIHFVTAVPPPPPHETAGTDKEEAFVPQSMEEEQENKS